ncbi:Nuf2 family-domain-containing protein [Amylostereum chailletii]|nr:Nuf2 family-domain-containing protein [Amylostereum chailletii]
MDPSERNGKQYWYPNLNDAEIVDALAAWGLSVSPQQLARPTSEFMITVCATCIRQVMGITEEVLEEPLQAALASLGAVNIDLYSGALSLNLLSYHISRFASAAQVRDFSIKDLMLPEPKRTRLIISAFVNLFNFTEQNNAFITSLREKSSALIEERDAAAEELARLKRQLAQRREERARDEPMIEELRRENADITATLIATKDIQTHLLKAIDELKAEKSAVLQTKEGLSAEISLAAEAVNRTRDRIVQSPDRVRRTIASMGQSVNEDKRVLASHEAKLREFTAKINALVAIEKDVRACVEQLQSIEKEVLSLEASQKELADVKEQLEQKTVERAELQSMHERTQKQLENAESRLTRTKRQIEEKRQASQQALDALRAEYEDMALERKDNDKQVEEVRRKVDGIKRKTAEHLKKNETELNALLAEYWRLRIDTEVYMETLANKLHMQVHAV